MCGISAIIGKTEEREMVDLLTDEEVYTFLRAKENNDRA
jgi:hypothetical protein